jgi:hypothetical protein
MQAQNTNYQRLGKTFIFQTPQQEIIDVPNMPTQHKTTKPAMISPDTFSSGRPHLMQTSATTRHGHPSNEHHCPRHGEPMVRSQNANIKISVEVINIYMTHIALPRSEPLPE